MNSTFHRCLSLVCCWLAVFQSVFVVLSLWGLKVKPVISAELEARPNAVSAVVFPGVHGAWSVPAAEEGCGAVHRVAERR